MSICLPDGVLQYARLARGAHEPTQDSSHGIFACLVNPHSQKVPYTPAGVCGSGQTTHTGRFRASIYVHARAIWAGATLDMVHLDRREVSGEPKSYARCLIYTVPCCKHLLSAKGSQHAFESAQSTGKE